MTSSVIWKTLDSLVLKGLLIVFILSVIFCFTPDVHALNVAPSAFSGKVSFGKTIKAIEVHGLSRMEEEELIDLICFTPGDKLTKEELRAGIRRAFKKGIFHDIKVISEPYDDGIKLIYLVEEIPLVHKIFVEGNEYFSEREIKREFYFKEGEEFHDVFLDKAKRTLLEFFKRKGFADARVEITIKKTEKDSEIDIYITVKEGQPLIIRDVEVPEDVRSLIRFVKGDIFDRDELDKDIRKIKGHYKKENYFNPIIGPYKFSDGVLIIPIKRGKKLELVFKDNTAISDKKLRKEVLFWEDEDITNELISEMANRIKRLYASKGYYYAQVAAGVESTEEVIKVTFVIFEGKKVTLRNINFEGITFKPEILKKIIPLNENKPFNSTLLNNSRNSLAGFYRALGYLEMKVVDIKKEFKNDGKDLTLTFVIDEGYQTKIKSIKIVGNNNVDTAEIRKVLNIKEGAPYNLIDIGDARYRILSLYSQYGYVDTNIDVESVIDDHEAVVTFKITENRPSIIGKIILRGNRKTKAKIITREFVFNEGEVYDQEKITRTKQKLYKLGLFTEVSIEMLEPYTRGKDRLVRDLLVSVKEGKAGAVEIGIGFGEYEKLRGSFDINYRNLGGYHRQIGFRAELSSVETRYILNFKEPWLFNKPNLSLKVFLMKEDRRSMNIETRDVLYKTDRFSFIASIEQELGKGLKAGLSYEYSFVDTKDVKPGVILSKEDTGTIGISSISPSLFYDTRDNPFDPTSGSLHGIVLKYASKLFLSETEFIKGTFQSSWFFPLIKRVVFAFSLRGGAAYGFEETEEIPLIERFFLGGRTTVRGYSHDTLGPKGSDGNPTGGNIFALTNVELRFSIGKGFGFVTFLDAGNVWRNSDEVRARLKYTAGAGLRYKTPVGPIRIDYGHKLNKEPDESSGEVHFSFGHAF
jgi:outer membrane protein insertion porin family